jgi:hypothetical protein
VLRLDREALVLAAVLDEDEPAGRLERAADARHHRGRVGQLVVDVDQQHEVAAARGQLRVGGGGELEPHVGQPLAVDARAEEPQHLRRDVGGVDEAGLADAPREPDGEVAGPRADVGDGHPG